MKIKVSHWLKLMFYMFCFGPVCFFIAISYRKLTGEVNTETSVFLALTVVVIIALVYMAARMYSMCSVELSDLKISQSSFYRKGKFLISKTIKWNEILNVSFKGSSYFFESDSEQIELNTSLFNNSEVVINFVRAHLSEPLLVQLSVQK